VNHDASSPRKRGSGFDSAGVPIHYEVRGDGPPVVLVHSFSGTFHGQFVRTGFADALAQRYRVAGLDLRGHGASGKPHDPAQYGVQMALDIVRLLDHLQIERAHVLGYSLGAHIVAQLLTLHPGRFLTAMLGGACGRRRWSQADDDRVAAEVDELEHGLLRTQLLRLWPGDRPSPDEAGLRALSAKYLAGNDPRALAAVRRSNRDQVVTDAQLSALKVPLLGIVGTEDPYVASFRDLAKVLPHMRLVMIDGATHNAAAARPEFLRAVEAFLADAPGP
jgi:pimeloyl-ACP methyl ester carboxylesterase